MFYEFHNLAVAQILSHMAVSNRPLLFVNESAFSPSPAKRREINAHVQKTRHERVRQQKIDALRSQRFSTIPRHSLYGDSNLPLPQSWNSTVSRSSVILGSDKDPSYCRGTEKCICKHRSKHEVSEQGVGLVRRKSQPTTQIHSPTMSLKRATTSHPSERSEETDDNSQVLLNQSISARRGETTLQWRPQGSAGDPFKTTAVELDAWTVSMLEYYLHLMSVGVFKAETAFLAPRQQFRHHKILQKAVNYSLTDETYFFALMAGSTGRLRLNTKHRNFRVAPEAFAGRALKALRTHLQQEEDCLKINPLIVLAIHAIMLFALYVMDYSAANAHLSIMIRIVDKLYGYQGLENVFQELCVEADVGLSRAAFKRPITPDTWYPKNLPGSRMKEIRSSLLPQVERAGQGFLRHSALLGEELSSIATATASVIQVASVAWENGGTSSTESQWLSQSSHALMHRLLVMIPSGDELSINADGSQLARQREAIHISFVIWLSFITTYLAPSPLGRRHPLRLQRALLQSRDCDSEALRTSWRGNEPLLMWVLSVGHSVAWITKSDTQEFFSTGVMDIAAAYQIHTVGQFRNTIESFLYNERAQGPSLRNLADRLRAQNATDRLPD